MDKPRPQWGRGVDSRHSRGGWEATAMEATWCSAVKGNTSSRGPWLERAGGWDNGDRPPSVLPPQPARLNSSGGTADGHVGTRAAGWPRQRAGVGPGRARPPSRPCGLCAPPPSCAGCGPGAPLKALGGTEAALERNGRGCAAAECAAGVHAAPLIGRSRRTAPPSISSNGSAPAACRRAASKIHGARDALLSLSWMTGGHMAEGAAGREGNHASTLPPTSSAAAVPQGRPTPQPAPTACVLVPGQEHPRQGGVSKYLLGVRIAGPLAWACWTGTRVGLAHRRGPVVRPDAPRPAATVGAELPKTRRATAASAVPPVCGHRQPRGGSGQGSPPGCCRPSGFLLTDSRCARIGMY